MHEKQITAKPAYLVSVSQLFRSLGASISGLDERAVKRSRLRWGSNTVTMRPRVHVIDVFLRQCTSPLTVALAIAAVLSLTLSAAIDALVITAVIAMNVFVGFTQEWKAEEAFHELSQLVLVSARVRRRRENVPSAIYSLPADQVVVGDIVLLVQGDVVSADGRLIEAKNFQVSESALTGESLPVDKRPGIARAPVGLSERSSMVHFGTHVTRGTATMVATAVGQKSEFGRIAELTAETREQRTPLQAELATLSKTLATIFVALSLVLVVVGFLEHRLLSEMLRVAVAVSVAAIPEGLLVAMTVILVFGMKRLLAQQCYVRRLVATEALGAVTVVCTDKTGTITTGQMIATHLENISSSFVVPAAHPKDAIPKWATALVEASVLASHMTWVEHTASAVVAPGSDAVESALVEAAERLGMDPRALESKPRIDEVSFDTERKMMAVLRRLPSGATLFVKGAPERVLRCCEHLMVDGVMERMSMERRLECEQRLRHLLGRGNRVLAVAQRAHLRATSGALAYSDCTALTLLGFIAFEDPIRADVKAAVAAAKRAGVRTLMVTGDHAETARSVAAAAGIAPADALVLDGAALDEMTEGELASSVRRAMIFARVEPRQKLRIIRALHANDELVAMIGDGMNDAPALKAADVGVAVGSGSDVAKEVSDIVLLSDSFVSFVAAIREGRIIVANIRKVLLYLLADSFSELLLIGASLLAGLPMPLLPLQILWINMVSDGFPYLALTVEHAEHGVMLEAPRAREEPLLNRDMKIIIVGMALTTNAALFGLFALLSTHGVEIAALQSIVFAALGVSSLTLVFACRSVREPLWRIPLSGNPFLFVAVGLGLAMMIAAVHLPVLERVLGTVPLTGADWALVGIIAVANLAVIELFKGIVRWYPKRDERLV